MVSTFYASVIVQICIFKNNITAVKDDFSGTRLNVELLRAIDQPNKKKVVVVVIVVIWGWYCFNLKSQRVPYVALHLCLFDKSWFVLLVV